MRFSDSPTSSLTVRTSWLVAGKCLGFAFTIAIPMLLVRRMPQHEFGLYKQIFLIISSAVTMLPMGFGLTAYYFLPREQEHRAQTVLNILLFTSCVGAMFGAVLLMYPQALVRLFKEPAAVQFAPWIGAVVLLWVTGSVLETVIVANQEVKLASGTIVAVQVMRAAFFVLAAAIGGTIRAVLYAAVAQGALQLGVLLVYLNSRFPGFWRAFDASFLWRQLAYALPFAAGGLVYSLQMDLHSYFVSKEFGAAAYAVYAIGCFQLPLFGILADSIGAVMIPRCSALQHQEATKELVLLTARVMRKLALLYFPVYVFLLVVRRDFIVVLFTERYLASVPIFAVNLTLIPLGIFVLDPVIRAYSAHRHFPLKLHATLLACLAVALPIAIGRYGLMGAIGVVVAMTVVSRAAGLIKVAAILGARVRDLVLLTDLAKAAAAAIAAGILTQIVHTMALGLSPLPVLVLCGLCFGATYLAATILLGLATAEERALIVRYIGRVWPPIDRPRSVALRDM